MADLHLWNLSFIDAVLILSPTGMLGLPFLIRAKGFSAMVFVTEVAVKLGKLIMEDLVSMHEEFGWFYGSEESSIPHWMKWEELASLPSALKEIVLGTDEIELGGWMPLYSDLEELLLHADESSEEMDKLNFMLMRAPVQLMLLKPVVQFSFL